METRPSIEEILSSLSSEIYFVTTQDMKSASAAQLDVSGLEELVQTLSQQSAQCVKEAPHIC